MWNVDVNVDVNVLGKRAVGQLINQSIRLLIWELLFFLCTS